MVATNVSARSGTGTDALFGSIFAEDITHCFGTRHCHDGAFAIDNGIHTAALVAQIAGQPTPLVTMMQPHGGEVAVVDAPVATPPAADALVTSTRGLALGVRTADCAPILLADAQAAVVAAAHAGWRGIAAGIIANTIRVMLQLGASRQRIRAVIGPCISQAAYTVGTDMYTLCMAADSALQSCFRPNGDKHYTFSLADAAYSQLRRNGITHIEHLRYCTCHDADLLYSYRRGNHSERQLSFISTHRRTSCGTHSVR